MTQSLAAFTPDCQVAAPHRLIHIFIGYISPRICLEISPLKKLLLGSRGPFKTTTNTLKRWQTFSLSHLKPAYSYWWLLALITTKPRPYRQTFSSKDADRAGHLPTSWKYIGCELSKTDCQILGFEISTAALLWSPDCCKWGTRQSCLFYIFKQTVSVIV